MRHLVPLLVATLLSGSAAASAASPAPSPAPVAGTPPAAIEVVFDRNWLVNEGLWTISDRSYPRFPEVFPGSSNGLLGADDPRSLWVNAPGQWGKYPVRVERHDDRPPVPRRCEDVVEVSLRAIGRRPVIMGSFDTWSGSLGLDRGTYRVRLCVSNLDDAATEPEFDGPRWHVYSSAYRFQIWPAPLRPGKILRVGSDWARDQHANVEEHVRS